jgi:hypothetical protein
MYLHTYAHMGYVLMKSKTTNYLGLTRYKYEYEQGIYVAVLFDFLTIRIDS